MKVWARNLSNLSFVISALILNVVSVQAHAGITRTDPRPSKASVVVAGITGTDPRPTKTSVTVAGITGTDPRPTKTSVMAA